MSLKITALFVSVLLVITTAVAQQKGGPDKNIETILGTWKVQKILSGNTEVAKNPTSGHWIEFRNDGKYVHQSTTLDSGSFRMNENHSVLYLESHAHASAAGKPNIVEWTISVKDDALTMQQKSTEKKGKSHADTMKYVYVRIEKGSRHLNN